MLQEVSTYQLLDGRRCGDALRADITKQAAEVRSKRGRAPHLAAVLVGEDGASKTYVESKVKACESVGFRSTLIKRPATISEEELLDLIKQLNKDKELDGFIVQLPLPEHIDEENVTLAISPDKDVDGFHPENIGRMVLGLPGFLPATPAGICELLKYYHIETAGRHAVVVGRSSIVGTADEHSAQPQCISWQLHGDAGPQPHQGPCIDHAPGRHPDRGCRATGDDRS
jgi:methylenetetrahydrofolate dehydrogenase (NADP+)/methenyltetrahydrofolate cyclohydrolase